MVKVSVQDQILRLVIAAILGGIIGWERGSGNRPAGLRTHMLVAVGSAVIMIISQTVFLEYGQTGDTRVDPGRLAAQVVSGIGFLGAGTILRDGFTIKGLTTAASLWVVAALGLAVGIGAYVTAVTATAVTLTTLVYLQRLERNLQLKGAIRPLRMVVADQPGQLGRIGSILGNYRIDIRSIELHQTKDQRVTIEMLVKLPPHLDFMALSQELLQLDGVDEVETDEFAN